MWVLVSLASHQTFRGKKMKIFNVKGSIAQDDIVYVNKEQRLGCTPLMRWEILEILKSMTESNQKWVLERLHKLEYSIKE